MITIEQIKAARGLLEWNQEDLARASRISKNAINNLERRVVNPRADTITAIQESFEDAGVEFLENNGLRMVGERINVRMFEGKDAVFKLFQDITDTLSAGEYMLVNGVDERKFMAAGEERFKAYLKKWEDLDIPAKLLVVEGDDYFIDVPEHYRWVPEEQWSRIPYFVYGDKYGVLLWEPIQRVLLIENKSIAESYRVQFEALWANAKIHGITKQS